MKNKFFEKYVHSAIGLCIVLALSINLIIESLGRQSIIGGISFFVDKPLTYLYNSLIIFACLSLAIVFKRRVFAYILLSTLWLTVGIINGVILRNRMTPFTTKDATVLQDGLSIATNYLSKSQIIFAVAGVVLLVAGIIALFIFAPKAKHKFSRGKNMAIFLAIVVGTFGMTNLAIQAKVVDTYFGNLGYAYKDYGVPYCFLSTWLNTGIKMPAGYSKAAIEGIFEEEEEPSVEAKTNIVFLQMESFVDPTLFKNITLSEDPVPNFRKLKEDFSSGLLTVPVVGAGTANTEFETITGMSAKFFGPGEYPYKSILLEETAESIPFDLKELGYSTHAIHNHRAVFYGRNKVFEELGFDTFTSLEYMIGPVKTPKNWAKDGLLTGEIVAALDSTPGQDYIYTISVQGHGKYPMEQVIMNPKVTVGGLESDTLKWEYEYYVNQVYEMDQFIKNLTDTLSKYDEKVVVVLYGDHLPALEFIESDISTHSLYKTEYVIWDNFGMSNTKVDLTAYQLGADVLDRLGIHNGTMTRLHQTKKDEGSYLSDLKLLQYDMLYGKRFIYGSKNPFIATTIKMGVNPISIDEIVEISGKFYLKGHNFTEYSKVSLDGKILKTIYLSPTILGLLEEAAPEDIPNMKVSQLDKSSKEILSTTE